MPEQLLRRPRFYLSIASLGLTCLLGGCTLRAPLELPPSSLTTLRAARSVFVKSEPPGLSDYLAQEIIQRLKRCNVDVRIAGSAAADVFVTYEEEDTGICLDCESPPPDYARATIRIGQGEELKWSATRSHSCTSGSCLMTSFAIQWTRAWCGPKSHASRAPSAHIRGPSVP
jgi:hypothetical protein